MTDQKEISEQQSQDFVAIRDLFYMCVARWRWFVLSLAICIGVAVCYLLVTEPVYTRTASVLIKDDSNGKSMSGDMDAFSNLGLFSSNSNVNNEMGILSSPDLMREVINRLHLETNYRVPGLFHKNTVYGSELPVNVIFPELADSESAGCRLEVNDDGTVTLSDFERNDEKFDGEISGRLNDTILSPVGSIVVVPTAFSNDTAYDAIFVSRMSIYSAISAYTENFSVTRTDEKSNIISLAYKDVSICRAQEILINHIAVYNEDWVKDKNRMAVSTSMFIDERLELIKSELGNVEENISSYKSEHLLPDVQASANMYISQASESEALIRDLNTQVYMARYIRNYLNDENNKFQMIPANSGIENQGLTAQINEYNKQLLDRNNLVASSSTRNPLVLQLDDVITAMRKALLVSIDNELVALDTQIKSQKNYGAHATSQIASNPKQAKYLLGIERQQKVKESLYLFLLQKREENELSQAFTAYNTRIITMPYGSLLPTYPVTRNILLLALALGMLVPIIIIFIKESMNTVVRGREDLKKLTIPVIGEIPQYVHDKKKRLFKKRQPEVRAVVVKPGNRDVINEAFRVLRTNLEFMSDESNSHNVFVFTSFNPGSGKSFLCMNVAVSFAIKNHTVLVIDGDMRHASASAFIGSPKPGLSDYLCGRVNGIDDVIVKHKKYECLNVLPVGTIPPNPTELLFSDKLKQLLSAVREQYDYVFIDCPPIEMVADTQIIEKLADRTIFVIRAGLLERSMLPELETLYTEKRYKNMSVILNGTVAVGGRYGYRYGYHYGYGSSYHYGNEDTEHRGG